MIFIEKWPITKRFVHGIAEKWLSVSGVKSAPRLSCKGPQFFYIPFTLTLPRTFSKIVLTKILNVILYSQKVTCDSHPCKNNATCTDGVDGYNCIIIHFFPTAYRIIFKQSTTESYAIKANAISSNLTEFTVCLFVKRKDINSSHYQCVYSYAEASGYDIGNAIHVCLNTPNIEILSMWITADTSKWCIKPNFWKWNWENSNAPRNSLWLFPGRLAL